MDVKLLAFFLTIFFVTGVGFSLGYILKSWLLNRVRGNLEERLSRMRVDAQDKIAKLKAQANEEVSEIRSQILIRQETIDKKESALLERQTHLDELDLRLRTEKTTQEQTEKEIQKTREETEQQLTHISGMTNTQARDFLLAAVETEHQDSLTRRIYQLEQQGNESLEHKSKEILTAAIQRYGNSVDNDILSVHVALPDEDSKGKIIGKEGRNIKAFEKSTGVQLVVDDTPGIISISSFDPIRRAIAKTALENLIVDGRIQPARIESIVEKSKQEIDSIIIAKGTDAANECGVLGLPKELLHILGRLYFRYSFGQNVLQHSVEMSHIAKVLATEIGADIYVARAGALLHDIGKAVDHEVDGTHVEIGRRILHKYGVDEAIIRAMEAHHEEYPYTSLESRIVQTADSISSARPGARSDNAEVFIKKVEDLERIARAIDGVQDAYAVSAGREIRIFVNPAEVNDYQAVKIAQKIAKTIEQELKYPGEIKVNVIREQRTIEFAR